MATMTTTNAKGQLLDKRVLQSTVAKIDSRMGFVPDLTATGESSQAKMSALGIKPEDRQLSMEIKRMRRKYDESE